MIALREPDDLFQFAARFGIDSPLLARLTLLLTEIPLTIQQDEGPRWRFPELEIRLAGILDRDTARLQHVMAIPLIVSEKLLGVIYAFRSWREAAFATMDEDALAVFADHVAIATI